MTKKIGIILFLIFELQMLPAQWECPSKMGSFLKPFGNSDLLYASEITLSGGYIGSSPIYRAMAFVGLDYTKDNHSFYLEGGFKYWRRKDTIYEARDYVFDNYKLGFREAFYQNKSKIGNVTVGLSSSSLHDNYLLNERVLGLGYNHSFSAYKLSFIAGTVSQDFSREGTFCTTRYIYEVIQNRDRPTIGNELWKSNLIGLTFSLLPNKLSVKKSETTGVSEDEFETFDEFEPAKEEKKPIINIDEFGIALYNEFGSRIDSMPLIGGVYANFDLFNGLLIKPEVLYQSAENNNGVIVSLGISKNILFGSSHKIQLGGDIVGFSSFDSAGKALNSYSNLLVGEVLRIDVPELPLYVAGIKYTVPKFKFHTKLQFAGYMHANTMSEIDLQIGKTFFKRIFVNAILGYINSKQLISGEDSALMGRVEIRVGI